MKLIYDIHDKPKFPQLLIFALQQVLAILAATIAVPSIIGHGMSQSAALFGAGVGTLVYQLFTSLEALYTWALLLRSWALWVRPLPALPRSPQVMWV